MSALCFWLSAFPNWPIGSLPESAGEVSSVANRAENWVHVFLQGYFMLALFFFSFAPVWKPLLAPVANLESKLSSLCFRSACDDADIYSPIILASKWTLCNGQLLTRQWATNLAGLELWQLVVIQQHGAFNHMDQMRFNCFLGNGLSWGQMASRSQVPKAQFSVVLFKNSAMALLQCFTSSHDAIWQEVRKDRNAGWLCKLILFPHPFFVHSG